MKNSFKVFFAATLLLFATQSTFAQFDNNRVPSRFHMGIRGGLSSNTYTGDVNNIDPLVAFTGGLAFDIQLAPVPVYIGFGFNYLNEGYKISSGKKDYSEDISAVHIPLVIGYHFNLSPNFFISPYLGGFTSYSVEDLDGDEGWNEDRYNYGLRLGLGLNFGRLTFDAAYDFGLKNIIDSKDYSAHTATFFLTLGFNMVGSR